MGIAAETEATSAEDQGRFRAWADHLVDAASNLPVSFVYGGSRIQGIPSHWSPARTFRRVGATITETSYEGRDPETGLGLRVEVVRYLDFPVIEWTTWLTNHSDHPTARAQELLGIDATFAGRNGAIYHGNGDFYNNDGYSWQTTSMTDREPLEVRPNGGRPCDGAFPYFRLLFEGGGLTLAIGWPGQWLARFGDEGWGISVKAGQEHTDLVLLPGEVVRTPRVTLMGWAGDEGHAVNLWRRWYRSHVMPRPGGKAARPLLSATGTDEGVEYTGATEANQLEYQRRWAAQDVNYDLWWIDAGWYPCRDKEGKGDWWKTGTWRTDPDRFPEGLAPVSAGAAEYGAQLLLWFEPERVFPGTELALEHPEWVLAKPASDADVGQNPRRPPSGLLDLSNSMCRDWLTDYISGLITSYGIGIYRQDFNFPPLEYWRAHDAEDRQGMTENLHVQGYLAFWDELLERHPSLLIDSCASGGRRNDLETMRRSVPLHYTDWGYGQHPTKLDFHRTMFEWLPYFKETTLSWDISEATQAGLEAKEEDSFAFHCALAPMMAPAVDIKRPDNDFTTVRKMVRIWRSISEMLLDGDYYPLTPPGRSGREWVIWQFNQPPDFGDRTGSAGFVQAIRLAGSDEDRAKVSLRALNPELVYVLEEAETGERREMPGSSLLDEGFVVDLPRRRGTIWTYREKVL